MYCTLTVTVSESSNYKLGCLDKEKLTDLDTHTTDKVIYGGRNKGHLDNTKMI